MLRGRLAVGGLAGAMTFLVALPGLPIHGEGPPRPQSDAEIIALLTALDENEVHIASTMEEKKATGPVLAFAQMLHQDHHKDIEDTKALADKILVKPTTTPAVEQLRAKGKEQLTKLIPLDGDALNRAFVTEMANGHRDALLLLDQMLDAAQNEELKKHVSNARQKVAAHLQEAERLKNETLKDGK